VIQKSTVMQKSTVIHKSTVMRKSTRGPAGPPQDRSGTRDPLHIYQKWTPSVSGPHLPKVDTPRKWTRNLWRGRRGRRRRRVPLCCFTSGHLRGLSTFGTCCPLTEGVHIWQMRSERQEARVKEHEDRRRSKQVCTTTAQKCAAVPRRARI